MKEKKTKAMNERQFKFEPYRGMNTRYHCPACKSRDKTFVRYIYTETGQHVQENVGRCNRESKCGYHYTPKQYFQDNNISIDTTNHLIQQAPPKREASFIDANILTSTLKQYELNNFVKFLTDLFDEDISRHLREKYNIGTSKYWHGSTVFWQIDKKGRIRDGKIIKYEILPEEKSFIGLDCKRSKTNIPPVQWVHSVTKQPEFKLEQCLFGEHLLVDKAKPVAIVESEKTAIINSVYLPQFIWLACGGLDQLTFEKCLVLAGRKVFLFPDLNGFDKWSVKARDLNERIPNIRFKVSDLLEKSANKDERGKGLDLADYLIRNDIKQFRITPAVEAIENNPAQVIKEDPINWYNGHLFPSMALNDSLTFVDSLPFNLHNN